MALAHQCTCIAQRMKNGTSRIGVPLRMPVVFRRVNHTWLVARVQQCFFGRVGPQSGGFVALWNVDIVASLRRLLFLASGNAVNA